MLTRWYDIDREMAALNELHRRVNRLFGDEGFARRGPTALTGSWPLANLYDTGNVLTALIQVPGVSEKELNIEVHNDVLTIGGERKVDAPEGYKVHRSERGMGTRKFSRSFGLPIRVDPEKTTAKLVNGLLTVTMEKHPDSQPRKIEVSAG